MHTYALTCSRFHGLKNALRSKVVTGDAGDAEAESRHIVCAAWAYDKGVGWKTFREGGFAFSFRCWKGKGQRAKGQALSSSGPQ